MNSIQSFDSPKKEEVITEKVFTKIPNIKSFIIKIISYFHEFQLDENNRGNEFVFREIMKYKESLTEHINLEIKLILDDCYLRSANDYFLQNIDEIKIEHEKILKEYAEKIIRIKINKIFEKYGSPYRCPDSGFTLKEKIEYFSIKSGEVLGIFFR